MISDNTLINVPITTVRLLKIAILNDKSKALTNNLALFTVLKLGYELLEICKSSDREAKLSKRLDVEDLPLYFLPFTGLLLQVVQQEINRIYRDKSSKLKIPVVSDYDNMVLQAFGQSLADIIWTNRDLKDLNGPALSIVLDMINEQNILSIWGNTLTNYLGNLLQHYFSASKIRKVNSQLPDNTEAILRTRDSKVLVYYTLRKFKPQGNVEGDIKTVLMSLRNTIIELLQVKKEYHGN